MEPFGTCYVCFGDGAPVCQCACINRYAHAHCLCKIASTLRVTHCTVCLRALPVKLYTTKRRRATSRVLSFVVAVLVFFSFTVFILARVTHAVACRLADEPLWSYVFEWCMSFTLFQMLLTFIVWEIRKWRVGAWSPTTVHSQVHAEYLYHAVTPHTV